MPEVAVLPQIWAERFAKSRLAMKKHRGITEDDIPFERYSVDDEDPEGCVPFDRLEDYFRQNFYLGAQIGAVWKLVDSENPDVTVTQAQLKDALSTLPIGHRLSTQELIRIAEKAPEDRTVFEAEIYQETFAL